MNTSCHHCPHCAVCYSDYKSCIEHFRVGGRLVFASCPDMKKE